MVIKIALVDDHAILRKSLSVLIGMLKYFEVIMEAGNGRELIDNLSENNLPDIVLMDITMPVMDGVTATKILKQEYPKIKVVALSMIKNDLVIIRMLKNGARGYILKDSEPEELQKALLDVYYRGYYYNEIFDPNWKNILDQNSKLAEVMINENELTFLKLCCTEKSYKEIADDMGVSPRTVDGYRDALFKKLNVMTRVGLVIYTIKNELVTL
jgi:two-component system invasion response regulator UvrY